MKHSGDDIDKILSRGLKSRFDESEAPVDDTLYGRIRKQLGRSGRSVALSVLLVFLLIGFLVWKNTADSSSGMAKVSHHANPALPSDPDSLTDMKPGRQAENTTDLRSVRNVDQRDNNPISGQKQRQVNDTKTGTSLFQKQSRDVAISRTELIPIGGKPGENTAETAFNEPVKTQLLEPLPYATHIDLRLPEVMQASTQATAGILKQNISWILAFSPMQNFQTLRVRSGPLGNYHDIRFPSLLSLQAKTFQLSAGAELMGFQILTHYTFSQNRIFYQQGTGRYDIEPVLNGADKITEITTNEALDERLHRIGLGINKVFAPTSGPFRSYELTAGIQYDRTLKPGQNVFWANAGLLKRIHLNGNSRLMVGPYAQIGLNNQQASVSGWQYRPLQIGVTAAVKLNPINCNHYLTR
jgi:hypothetical protein